MFSIAVGKAQTGTAPNTRISDVMPFSLKLRASSIDATPSISILLLNRVGASIAAPCPYASAFTTAKTFMLPGIQLFKAFTFDETLSMFISTQESL